MASRVKLAPYSKAGDLLVFPAVRLLWDQETRRADRIDESIWRPIVPFEARLDLIGHERGRVPFDARLNLIEHERSRFPYRFVWRDENGRRYPMFLLDAVETIQERGILGGRTVRTWWIPQKRGQNYGIRVATRDEVAAYRIQRGELVA